MSAPDTISIDSRIGEHGTSSDEEADEVTALTSPVGTFDSALNSGAPSWIQELNRSRVTRHSRASSIISTRTRFSTNTLQDDARSIDINVGGHYFRISRDGSHVSDAPRSSEAPPPYTEPRTPLAYRGGRPGGSSSMDRYDGPDNEPLREDEQTPTRQNSNSFEFGVRANILNPSEVEMPSPIPADQDGPQSSTPPLEDIQALSVAATENTPARNPSYKSGVEVLSIAPEARRQRTVSYDDLPGPSIRSSHATIPLKRWNGVRLPRLNTSTTLTLTRIPIGNSPGSGSREPSRIPSSDFPLPPQTRSAGPILSTTRPDDVPQSPNFIGRNATAFFPMPKRQVTAIFDPDQSGDAIQVATDTRDVNTVSQDQDTLHEGTTPLPMDTENDISLHYTRLMRRLDRDHRQALHLKDKELAEYRVRLNEMDTVYRQELRARDFIIDDLKKRLAHLEESTELTVEKARNQVEDLWESRWKDRDFHLRERMRRIEEEAQKTIDDLLTQITSAPNEND